MELTKNDFKLIRDYIQETCGINLGADKEYLVHQRLESVAEAQGCKSFTEFALLLRACNDAALRDQVVAAITTNETSFFRDVHPYEMFRTTLLPQLAALAHKRKQAGHDRKGAKVSILSAGSSTGQEPYSLSIAINEYLQFKNYQGVVPEDFEIVATDVSPRVLAKAVAGEYAEAEIKRGLTETQAALYFTRENSVWAIKDAIRRIVEFRRVNLIESFVHLGGFDLIFCRNVLIYFDLAARQRIFDQFFSMLSPSGFLVLGSTETVYGVSELFESCRAQESVYYIKKNPSLQQVPHAGANHVPAAHYKGVPA